MADISLVIGVEQGGLLKAIANTESLEKKVKKLSDAYNRGDATVGRYNRAIAKLAKSSKQSVDELQRYGKRLRDNEKAIKKATAETKAYALARKKASEEDQRITNNLRKATAETKKLASEVDRLSSKYKPLYASSKQYEKSLDEINRAHKVGAINTQQHSAAKTTKHEFHNHSFFIAQTGTNKQFSSTKKFRIILLAGVHVNAASHSLIHAKKKHKGRPLVLRRLKRGASSS